MEIRLRELAETPRPIHLHLPAEWVLEKLSRGHPDLVLADDGVFEGQGYLTKQGAVVQGVIELGIAARCARCLARIDLRAKLPCRWILTRDHALAEGDPETLLIDSTGRVDVEGPMAEAIDLNVPSVLLCSKDCAGLCAECGADLNDGPCGCRGGGENTS